MKNLLQKISQRWKGETSAVVHVPVVSVEDSSSTRDTAASTLGDGKAVVLSDMTEEEYADYMHNEVHGWKKFNEVVARITAPK